MPPSHQYSDFEALVWVSDRPREAAPNLVPVLVVCQPESGRSELEEILRPPSFSILVAASAEEAARLLCETAVPVVLAECDSASHRLDELRNLIRALHLRPAPRLIVMGDADDCLLDKVGAFEAVAKPLVCDDLVWAVTDAWMDWRRELERSGRKGRAVRAAGR